MKKTDKPHAVGPLFTLSTDDETAIYDYHCFPPTPDKIERIK